MINNPLLLVNTYIVKIDEKFDIDSRIGFFDSNIKAKILSFHRKRDRVVAFTSHLLQRYFIAKLYNVLPYDLILEYNECGKPQLLLPDNTPIKYNISHSGDYLVLAIFNGDGYDIGIDIEKIIPNDDYQMMSHVAFSKFEQQQVTDHITFYKLWAKKEALLKAIGCGFMTEFYQYTKLTISDVNHNSNYLIHSSLFEDYCISVCLCKT